MLPYLPSNGFNFSNIKKSCVINPMEMVDSLMFCLASPEFHNQMNCYGSLIGSTSFTMCKEIPMPCPRN